jgi:hypothetical protein
LNVNVQWIVLGYQLLVIRLCQCKNPNIEFRNPKQIRITKIQMTKIEHQIIRLIESNDFVSVIKTFEFRICLEFRASDFEFNARALAQRIR